MKEDLIDILREMNRADNMIRQCGSSAVLFKQAIADATEIRRKLRAYSVEDILIAQKIVNSEIQNEKIDRKAAIESSRIERYKAKSIFGKLLFKVKEHFK